MIWSVIRLVSVIKHRAPKGALRFSAAFNASADKFAPESTERQKVHLDVKNGAGEFRLDEPESTERQKVH